MTFTQQPKKCGFFFNRHKWYEYKDSHNDIRVCLKCGVREQYSTEMFITWYSDGVASKEELARIKCSRTEKGVLNLPETNKKSFVLVIWIDGKKDTNLEIDETTYFKIQKLLPRDEPV
jgi:hypothetical protein